jgi:hypothetical protein
MCGAWLRAWVCGHRAGAPEPGAAPRCGGTAGRRQGVRETEVGRPGLGGSSRDSIEGRHQGVTE